MTPDLREQLHIIEQTMNLGNMDQSIKLLEELSKSYPDNYHVASLLGECYLMVGKPDKAIKPLKWATKTFPLLDTQENQDAETTEKNTTETFFPETDDESMTIDLIRRNKDNSKENNIWVDHYLLGCAYGRCMKFRPAIQHLNIADKMSPKNAEIIRNIGWIRCMQEKTDTGRDLLKRAIDLDPDNALAYNDLGASYMFEEKFEEAKKWIGKAVKMDPEDKFIQNTAEKLEDLMAYSVIMKKKLSSPSSKK